MYIPTVEAVVAHLNRLSVNAMVVGSIQIQRNYIFSFPCSGKEQAVALVYAF